MNTFTRLVKRKTEDGFMEVMDQVPLGRVYRVDLEKATTVILLDRESGSVHSKVVVPDLDAPGVTLGSPGLGWLPVELLDIGQQGEV